MKSYTTSYNVRCLPFLSLFNFLSERDQKRHKLTIIETGEITQSSLLTTFKAPINHNNNSNNSGGDSSACSGINNYHSSNIYNVPGTMLTAISTLSHLIHITIWLDDYYSHYNECTGTVLIGEGLASALTIFRMGTWEDSPFYLKTVVIENFFLIRSPNWFHETSSHSSWHFLTKVNQVQSFFQATAVKYCHHDVIWATWPGLVSLQPDLAPQVG